MRYDDEGELQHDPLYSVMHMGTVADRSDPEKLGRVRLIVPGIFQATAPSPWAWPLGTLKGGSAQRGAFFVPEKGADVAVFFKMGDPEQPHYLAGHWGKPDGTSEIPTSTVGDPDVGAIETKNFLIVFDDRSGSEQLLIKDKTNAAGVIRIAGGKIYQGDAAADEPFVKGNQWKAGMEAILDAVVALTVPTGVGPSGPPINSAAFVAQKAALAAKLSAIIYGK